MKHATRPGRRQTMLRVSLGSPHCPETLFDPDFRATVDDRVAMVYVQMEARRDQDLIDAGLVTAHIDLDDDAGGAVWFEFRQREDPVTLVPDFVARKLRDMGPGQTTLTVPSELRSVLHLVQDELMKAAALETRAHWIDGDDDVLLTWDPPTATPLRHGTVLDSLRRRVRSNK